MNISRFINLRSIVVTVFILLTVAGWLYYYAFHIEPNRLVINDYKLVSKAEPGQFPSLKVVAISDIHGGSAFIDEKKITNVVMEANSQNPDLILLLGDFVSQKRIEGVSVKDRPLKLSIEKIAAKLAGLRAKYGVIAVIGNHDDWYDRKVVREALESARITVLVDEVRTLSINDKELHVLGLRDLLSVYEWRKYNRELLEMIKKKGIEGKPILVAAHNPDSGALLSGSPLGIADQIAVVFAGHTHGGQVWFPVVGSQVVPSNFGKKYAYGVVEDKRFPFFVTTGIGTSIAPVRFLVPPEIAVVELEAR